MNHFDGELNTMSSIMCINTDSRHICAISTLRDPNTLTIDTNGTDHPTMTSLDPVDTLSPHEMGSPIDPIALPLTNTVLLDGGSS